MRHLKVVSQTDEYHNGPYLRLELPDGTRHEVPEGLDVSEGDVLIVVKPNGQQVKHQPAYLAAFRLRRDRVRKVGKKCP